MPLTNVETAVDARTGVDKLWARLRVEAASAAAEEPILASFLNAAILRHDKFAHALAYRIASKMADAQLDSMLLRLEYASRCASECFGEPAVRACDLRVACAVRARSRSSLWLSFTLCSGTS